MPSPSVVALEDDLLLVPAEAGEEFSDAGDHEVEAADVGVDVEGEILGGNGGIDRRRGQRLAESGGAVL